MGCPRLQKCCCFFDLKTGSIILGCIVAIISIGLFTTMLVITIEIGDIEKNIDKHLRILSEIEKAKDTGLRGPYALSIITVFMFLAKSLFDVFFIYGVCRERAGIIKSYLIINARGQSSGPLTTPANDANSHRKHVQDIKDSQKVVLEVQPKIRFKTLELLKRKQEVIDLTKD
ncbi:hypothetical protein MSG28_007838 [Choristoneura fumiferana]|uniref:Uncharacterized protein n=1 Tax=Choristoneura fumiferana TaxID=7141 RepID=A0ACC0J8Y9_CHOFU|nr:hypothetical protein MSG28_007838 [Choristoneura fumiferana]